MLSCSPAVTLGLHLWARCLHLECGGEALPRASAAPAAGAGEAGFGSVPSASSHPVRLSRSLVRVVLLPSSIVGPPHTAKLAPLGAGVGSPPRVGREPSRCLPNGTVLILFPVVLRKRSACFPPPPRPPCAEPTPLELACFSLKVPPSTVAKLEMWRQVQLGEAEIGAARYDGRVHLPGDPTLPPLLPDGLPLGFCRLPYVDPEFLLPAALMHPCFGQFADEVAALLVETEDCDLVDELIQDGPHGMAYLHPSLSEYQEVFSLHFGQFLSAVGLAVSPSVTIGAYGKGGRAFSLSSSSPRAFQRAAGVLDKSKTFPLCMMVRPPCRVSPPCVSCPPLLPPWLCVSPPLPPPNA